MVRDKLTPRYAVGCKRPGFHNTYLSTFNRDNVELVTEPIDKITGSGVATADGETHEVDVLILATGFKVMDTDACRRIRSPVRGGRSLSRFWDENRLQAYEGVSIPGFPNFFTRVRTVRLRRVVVLRADRGADPPHRALPEAGATAAAPRRVEVTQEANDRYFAEMMRKRHRQIFWQDSCQLANSYYFDKNGDVPLRPATTVEAYWRSRRFPLDDCILSA